MSIVTRQSSKYYKYVEYIDAVVENVNNRVILINNILKRQRASGVQASRVQEILSSYVEEWGSRVSRPMSVKAATWAFENRKYLEEVKAVTYSSRDCLELEVVQRDFVSCLIANKIDFSYTEKNKEYETSCIDELEELLAYVDSYADVRCEWRSLVDGNKLLIMWNKLFCYYLDNVKEFAEVMIDKCNALGMSVI